MGERGLKYDLYLVSSDYIKSLSSRRALIEMAEGADDGESVDLGGRTIMKEWRGGGGSRSPHGERGLKSSTDYNDEVDGDVALLTESVD